MGRGRPLAFWSVSMLIFQTFEPPESYHVFSTFDQNTAKQIINRPLAALSSICRRFSSAAPRWGGEGVKVEVSNSSASF